MPNKGCGYINQNFINISTKKSQKPGITQIFRITINPSTGNWVVVNRNCDRNSLWKKLKKNWRPLGGRTDKGILNTCMTSGASIAMHVVYTEFFESQNSGFFYEEEMKNEKFFIFFVEVERAFEHCSLANWQPYCLADA